MARLFFGKPDGKLFDNVADSIVTTSATPTLPPPPKFSDFKFNILGQQPSLLHRISDPKFNYQYQERPSPTPSFSDAEHCPTGSTAGQASSQTRPSLLEALGGSDDGKALSEDAADEMAVDSLATQHPREQTPELVPVSPAGPLGPARQAGFQASTEWANGGEVDHASNVPGTVNSGAHGTDVHSNADVSPTSRVEDPAIHISDASARLTSPPTAVSGVIRDLKCADVDMTLDASSPQLAYPSSPGPTPLHHDGSSFANASASQLSHIQLSGTNETSRTSSPVEDSSFTALRAIQSRLLASLYSLNAPEMHPALVLVQSANVLSADAVTTARHAHTLAQDSLASAQKACHAAHECLITAEASSTRAREALVEIEKLGSIVGEGQSRDWEWKQTVSGLQNDLHALGQWVGQKEAEDARLRREKERRKQQDRDKRAMEAAMNVQRQRLLAQASSIGPLNEQVGTSGMTRPAKRRRVEDDEVQQTHGASHLARGQEHSGQRSAELEASVARQAWERDPGTSSQSKAPGVVQNQTCESQAVGKDMFHYRSQQDAADKWAEIRVEEERIARDAENLTIRKLRQMEEDEKRDEELKRLQAEAEAEAKERQRLVEAQRQLRELEESRRQAEEERQRKEEEEAERRRTFAAEQKAQRDREDQKARLEAKRAAADEERMTRLLEEQERKRQEIKEQKQIATAHTAQEIRAQRERARQASGNGAATTTPRASPGLTSSFHVTPPTTAQMSQAKSGLQGSSTKMAIGNVVAKKTLIEPPPASSEVAAKPKKKKVRSISGGVKLGPSDGELSAPPSPALARSTALGLRTRLSLSSEASNTPLPYDQQSQAELTNDSRRGKAIENALNNWSSQAGMSMGNSLSVNGDAGFMDSASVTNTRQFSVPPINTMGSRQSESGPSTPSTPTIPVSVFCQSHDTGNISVIPRSQTSVVSPEAQAVNLRYITAPGSTDAQLPATILLRPKVEIGDDQPLLVKKKSSNKSSMIVPHPFPTPTKVKRHIEMRMVGESNETLSARNQLATSSSTIASTPPDATSKPTPPKRVRTGLKEQYDTQSSYEPFRTQVDHGSATTYSDTLVAQPSQGDRSYTEATLTSETLGDRLGGQVPLPPFHDNSVVKEMSMQASEYRPQEPVSESMGPYITDRTMENRSRTPIDNGDSFDTHQPRSRPRHRRGNKYLPAGGDHYSPPAPNHSLSPRPLTPDWPASPDHHDVPGSTRQAAWTPSSPRALSIPPRSYDRPQSYEPPRAHDPRIYETLEDHDFAPPCVPQKRSREREYAEEDSARPSPPLQRYQEVAYDRPKDLDRKGYFSAEQRRTPPDRPLSSRIERNTQTVGRGRGQSYRPSYASDNYTSTTQSRRIADCYRPPQPQEYAHTRARPTPPLEPRQDRERYHQLSQSESPDLLSRMTSAPSTRGQSGSRGGPRRGRGGGRGGPPPSLTQRISSGGNPLPLEMRFSQQ